MLYDKSDDVYSMFHEVGVVFDSLSHDPNVRSIVFSGAGDKAFSAGLDIRESTSAGPVGNPDSEDDFARRTWKIRRHALDYQNSVNAIERCEKPIICAMHGIAYGAAIDFATAADIRYCTNDVKISVKEIDAGLAPDVGTMTRLPKIGVSHSWAKEAVFTARVVGGAEAERVGLVSKTFDTKEQMIKSAIDLASEIATKSPIGVQSAKALWQFSQDRPISDGLLYTAIWNGSMVQAEDVKRAMINGIEKRKSSFAKL